MCFWPAVLQFGQGRESNGIPISIPATKILKIPSPVENLHVGFVGNCMHFMNHDIID